METELYQARLENRENSNLIKMKDSHYQEEIRKLKQFESEVKGLNEEIERCQQKLAREKGTVNTLELTLENLKNEKSHREKLMATIKVPLF